jgi:probable selenium-dependent hydroxylase accessory protein YqeC
VKGDKEKGEQTSILTSALGLKKREVISLTGAGGKTTLMFRLAKELCFEGKRVVTTTTTKILEPTSGEAVFLFVDPREEEVKRFVHIHLNEYRHLTIAAEKLGSGKLKGISPDLVNGLWSLKEIDYIIVETDGAAGRPVKAPREGEPVVPSSTTLVVAILGVDGVGMEVNAEKMFQAERVSKLTGIPEGREMTDEGMAVLMTHPEGIFKGAPSSSRVIAFLNKADIPDGVAKGRSVAQKIIERRHPQIERVVLGQLGSEPAVVEVIFP